MTKLITPPIQAPYRLPPLYSRVLSPAIVKSHEHPSAGLKPRLPDLRLVVDGVYGYKLGDGLGAGPSLPSEVTRLAFSRGRERPKVAVVNFVNRHPAV